MVKHLLAFVLLIFAAACSSQQILISAKTNLKLVNDSIGISVDGPNNETELLDHLTRELKARLILAGFDIEKQSTDKLLLHVNVSEFDPGDAATRMLVGFGAGRGSLVYSAEYKTIAGEVLAKMEGQERFTGGEVGFNMDYGHFATLGGEATVREVLVKEAAKHIVELGVNPSATSVPAPKNSTSTPAEN
jgi:hypothetical protein